MKGKKAITYLKEIENLGEFKFIFWDTPEKDIKEGMDKYMVEAIWNPKDYGIIHFLLGYYTDDIDKEIDKLDSDGGMDYYIDGARISCECALESTDDIDGVYTGTLMNYFVYSEEEIEKLEQN